MANLAQAVNVLQALILTKGDQMIRTPTYYVFDLYKVHQNAKYLPIKIQTPAYGYNGEKIPAVNASASRDSSGVTHITLVNLDPKNSISVFSTLPNPASLVTGQILTSPKFTDINTFEQPDKVQLQPFNNAKIINNQIETTLPPLSVVTLTLK